MNTQILYYWAQFHNMNNLQKRELFNKLISERLNINCEAQIYRVLTRFTFQSVRKKYGETYKFTPVEKQFEALMNGLSLSPSTVHNWYYATIQGHPLNLIKNECANLPTGNICDCCIGEEVKKRLENNYEFRLASKRLYQTIIKTELFKEELCKEKVFLDDAEIRRILRRLVEYTYYKKGKEYSLEDTVVIIQKTLLKKGVKPITVLKWFYLLQHHPELLKEVYQNKISPDDIFVQSGIKLVKDVRGGINATDCHVSN